MATRFGAYEILHELKHGGMGAVLLARRRGPGAFEQLVAIKTIRSEYAAAPAVRAMFLDEAAILARINHPGIAAVHDFGEQGDALYLAMEYVAGISFRALAELAPPPGVAARAIAEACRGLHAAHEVRDPSGGVMGVVHRDISPDNLMLGFDGHVKVIDFGIALVRNRQAPVTEFGTVKGKPPYMSPEQIKNETMDRRSDVFSLAVVLHELLTGSPLFDGDSIYAVARAVEHMDIRPPSQVRGTALPLGLDAAVMNALDRSLARRTPTAAAFAEELEQVISASGDETLEAWSERELAPRRAIHRQWVASLVAGHALPQLVGRATGAVTPIGSMGASPNEPVDPGGATHLAADDDEAGLSIPPRRGRLVPALLALVVLAGLVGGALFVMRERAAPAAPDAPVVVVQAPPPDAVVVVVQAPEPDAAEEAPPSPDAAERRTVHRHRPPRDAATVVKLSPDAAPAAPPPPVGTGWITVPVRDGTYFGLTIDGVTVIVPHIKKPIAAGPHTLVFLDPKDGHVLHRTTVEVRADQHLTVGLP